jgi:ubiquinol-cytochrome c reductase cytochrome c1 subunit
MIRIISILAGVFFSLALLTSFTKGAYSYVTEPPADTAVAEFHKEPKELDLPSNGPLGKFDMQQVQRGFQVYTEICSNCHMLHQVAFRDLKEIGYNDDEVKAIAAKLKIPHYNAKTGELTTANGVPTDHFPPVVYGGQGSPPDLSLITKAREGGAAYVYSVLTGFQDQPAALLAKFPDAKTPPGLWYNPYFANLNIAMPPPLTSDGQITYKDGTPATVNQMAKDVAAFLVWTAEPKLEDRHQAGLAVVGFLIFATILAYMAYQNVWAGKKH